MFESPEATTPTSEDTSLPAFTPVALARRRNGWTAERQRTFLVALAETGSISLACGEAGISARSAYRLRARPDAVAFALAWDHALKLATLRLTTLAFERATRGSVKETWKNGELVAETRSPSDKLLMFLLQHLLPAGIPGRSGGAADRWAGFDAMIAVTRAEFPTHLDALVDSDTPLVPVQNRDFYAAPPGDRDEDE